MAARRHHPIPRRTRERLSAIPITGDYALERIALVLALILVICRPLFPSEDADTGSGLVIVALWGLAACSWAAAQALRGHVRWHGRWFDLGPVVLFLMIIVSAWAADTPRPAINMACEWAGLIVAYYLIRQLCRDNVSQRIVLAAMVPLAFTLSLYGIYQVFFGFEALRDEYARDRLSILEKLRIIPNSPQEEVFRNRLNSHEPFATFALANSLAGFLLAWLPMGVAWCFQATWRRVTGPARSETGPPNTPHLNWIRMAFTTLLCFATLVAVILTQSRTAYAGLLVQIALVVWMSGREWLPGLRRQTILRSGVVGLIILVVLVAAIFESARRGKIDEKVFTHAQKSLGFRWQYWQATTQLIADRPWWGTGPGNFRGYYLRYKLADSSEEINDPHNMVLEMAATSGVPAGVLLVSIVVIGLVSMERSHASQAISQNNGGAMLLWPAGLCGFALAAILSSLEPFTYGVLFAVWSAAALAIWNLAAPPLRARIVAISLSGLSVHLLGAGGIGMPGVSLSLWVLLAIGLNLSDGPRAPVMVRSNLLRRALLLVFIAAWVWFGLSVLRPVTGSMSAVTLGRERVNQQDSAGSEQQFRAAAAMDPTWAEPWIELSRIHYERWRRGVGRLANDEFDQAERCLIEARRRAPSQLEPVRLLAGLYEARAESNPDYWRKAAGAYERCVEMYPTSASLHAHLAHALWNAGARTDAQYHAQRATTLSAATPHSDKKLTESERRLLEPLQPLPAPVK